MGLLLSKAENNSCIFYKFPSTFTSLNSRDEESGAMLNRMCERYKTNKLQLRYTQPKLNTM